MRSYGVFVIAICCIISASSAEDTYYGSVKEVLGLYNECSHSDGLSPCLKLKALSLIDRVSRMEKIDLLEGVTVTGKSEEDATSPSLEEVEKTLPRAVDAKSQALTSLMFNRIARMIGSKTISVSIPALVESARKKSGGGGGDDKFSEISELLSDKFGGSSGGGKGGGKGGKGGNKKGGGMNMKDFFMQMMAHKMAMIPLLIGGLFILAVKALTQAKIALLIAGIIFGKKLLANKGGNGGGGHVEHVQAGWSGGGGGGAGGWSGGSGGGWSSGGGGGGWDRRSLEAQNLAYSASSKQA